MRDGFIKVAAVTPEIKVAEPEYNTDSMIKSFDAAAGNGAEDHCLSGTFHHRVYMCGPFPAGSPAPQSFGTAAAFRRAHEGHGRALICRAPLRIRGELYNVAAAVQDGKILAFIPKRFIPNYSEFYEERWFMSGEMADEEIDFDGRRIPFGSRILFASMR